MLAIRMQRTGRSGHAQFRVVVQDSKFSPTRGRVVSYLGSYNPHTKTAQLDTDKVAKYLENGAQPSDRVARLLKKEGIKLPGWVKLSEPKKRDVRHPEKRRSTAPAQPQAEVPAEETVTEQEAETAPNEAPEDSPAGETSDKETPSQPEAPETPAETPADEKPAENS